ncbi:hypothetical protein DWU99_09050 [Dyella psychrodurans]|uniref:Uncharacterized protein n=1 Tax=Dyella psychrodurans TaxID=1927960 RepID=A0A370XB38_9GAMM|nr:hypothetical protein DWU99_09050 [Dyella psychrodurans]
MLHPARSPACRGGLGWGHARLRKSFTPSQPPPACRGRSTVRGVSRDGISHRAVARVGPGPR